MNRPSLEDLETAAAWLDCNEGADGEQAACERVAAWLGEQILQGELRLQARKARVPVAALRRAMVCGHVPKPVGGTIKTGTLPADKLDYSKTVT